FITPSDFIEKRFNHKGVTLLASLLMLYGLGNYLLEQIVVIGQGVSGLTGGTVPYQEAVIFFVTIMIIYGCIGGVRSVDYTFTLEGLAIMDYLNMILIGLCIY